MEKLSRQNVLDLVYNYYAKGGEVGVVGNTCIYFADNGGHCAVGVLLDHLGISRQDLRSRDRDYNTATHITEIMGFFGDRMTGRLETDVFTDPAYGSTVKKSFLLRMQNVHDDASRNPELGKSEKESVARRLQAFARVENLTVPGIKD